jgi:hypothetical protein
MPDWSPPEPGKVLPRVGPEKNVFRILPEKIKTFLINSFVAFLMHECP